MQTFTADDGEKLYLRISGRGSPLLLLHGWTASHGVWNPVLGALAEDHRVFCPDARGHGGHGLSVTATPDVARLARDVANLLDHFQLERVAVAGHSMGALTLWQYLRDHGCERLSHVCIIDQSPKLVTDATWSHGIYADFDAVRCQHLMDELRKDFAEAVLRLIAHGLNGKARTGYDKDSRGWQQARRELRKLDPVPLMSIWDSLVAADYRDVLPALSVPALLAWGGASNFYPLATAEYLLSRMPEARLSCYEGADHCPQLFEPARFAGELTAFILKTTV